MKLPRKWIAVLLTMFTCAGMACAADENLKAATDAAQQWLALVDAGQYDQSWDQASSPFKEKVTKEQWRSTMSSGRAPLGKMESRQFKDGQYETSLPGAPAGKYFVIQYRTKFANSGPMIETITPMLDKDGTWRVAGYYMRPDKE